MKPYFYAILLISPDGSTPGNNTKKIGFNDEVSK